MEKTASRFAVAVMVILPLAFLGLFFLWPTIRIIALGMGGGVDGFGGPDLGGGFGGALRETLARSRTWSTLFWTLEMGFLGTFFSVILGIAGAWTLYGLRIPGRRLWRTLTAVPFVLPSVVVGVAFQNILGAGAPLGFLGLGQTRAAIILAMVFFNFSLVSRIVGNAWIRLDPRPVQAARALGASPTRAFFTVTLPRLGPAIFAAASLVFLYCITSYGLVRVLGGVKITTLEVEIYLETASYLNLSGAAVLSLLQILIVVVALGLNSFARSRFEHRAALRMVAPRPVRREDAGALVSTGLGLLLVIVPLLSMVVTSFRRAGVWTFANYRALAQPNLVAQLPGTALGAWGYSLQVALLSCVISLVMGLSVSIVVSRRVALGSRWRAAQELFDLLFSSPQGISAVTVGFGMLITLQAPPLSMSANAFFLAAAQSVVAVPLVLRAVLPTLRAVNPRLREAAATLGANPWQSFRTVELPVLARVSGVGAGFAFAISLGEFGATSFLARPLNPTLPVAIFALSSRPAAEAQGAAAAASVLLALTCALAMFLAETGANFQVKASKITRGGV